MNKYIVVGPIDDLYYVAYRVPGTNTFQPINQFTSEALAADVASDLSGQE